MLFSHSAVSDSFETPRNVTWEPPLFTGFLRQEYWYGLPFPSPDDLPDSGINLYLLQWQVDSLPMSHQGSSSGIISIFLVSYSWSFGKGRTRIMEEEGHLPVPNAKSSFLCSYGQTQVSCIAGRFFTIWSTRETYNHITIYISSEIDLPNTFASLISNCICDNTQGTCKHKALMKYFWIGH